MRLKAGDKVVIKEADWKGPFRGVVVNRHGEYDDYVWVRFADGESGVVDFKEDDLEKVKEPPQWDQEAI